MGDPVSSDQPADDLPAIPLTCLCMCLQPRNDVSSDVIVPLNDATDDPEKENEEPTLGPLTRIARMFTSGSEGFGGKTDGDEAPSTPTTKIPRMFTSGSADVSERAAHMRIDMDKTRSSSLKQQRFSSVFRFNAEMALRVACGVLIASLIQTRDQAYDPGNAYVKKWLFFPSWYYIGGLSYCAIMVIFSTGINMGGTLREVCQGISGVGMALVYSLIMFAIIDVHTFDDKADEPYDDFYKVAKSVSSSSYWINLPNLYAAVPWMLVFIIGVLVLPFHANTRKFALGSNIYFTLTIIRPANPLDASQLKSSEDEFFDTANTLRNLQAYCVVGVVGAFISVFIMLIPYPVFAIRRLRVDSKKASEDILDLLNIIVDSYCFKNKNVEHMNFLKLKLRRKFAAAEVRHRRMLELLDDAWWEQFFGFHYLLRFNLPIMVNYVNLVGSLVADLRTLSYAMQLEKYERLHFTYMKAMQREIYVIQTRSGDLLNEISTEIHASTTRINLKAMRPLENQVETTLYKYRKTQNRTLRTQTVTLEEMAGNVPLNLFLFSLNSFCSTLLNFQQSHNSKHYGGARRARSFVKSSARSFIDPEYYAHPSTWLGAFKGSIAMVLGVFMAVYVYDFSSTVPGTIAYVMGNYLGGSFRVTVNRVGGVVAGSVVPSVFKFFFVRACSPKYMTVVLSDIVMFFWTGISMYVAYARGYSSYAGLVSAFISADILLRQTDMCYPNGSDSSSSIAISSYSSLAQTSVGVVMFIVVEILVFPKSATTLLRRNIQQTLKLQRTAFDALFGHHLSSSVRMDDDTMAQVRHILEVKIPRKLVKQKKLLVEAQAEPLMWRPAFSLQKYEHVLEISHRLLSNNNLLFKLVRWFHYRVEQGRVKINTDDIRDPRKDTGAEEESMSTHAKWQIASNHFQSSVRDTFDTMEMLFGESFMYSDPDQTAIFMQMKEAFRLADKDCSGEIDAEEVSVMLETIFSQSGAVKEEEIQKYVQEFMAAVDTDNSGMVSFEEFMAALENGLKLEVEVYHRRKPRAPALITGDLLEAIKEEVEAEINEVNEAGADESSNGNTGAGQGGASVPTEALEHAAQTEEAAADGLTDTGVEGTGSDSISTEDVVAQSLQKGDVAAAIDSSISRRVVDQRGSVTVEAISMTLTPGLLNAATSSRHEDKQHSSAGSQDKSESSSPMRREHDVLNVEDFSTNDVAAHMKSAYVEWLMEDKRYERVSMEEQLLLNCLVSGAEGIAKNLTSLEEVVVSS